MMRPVRIAFAAGLALTLAAPLSAHHLGQTVYDSSKKISLEGRVSKVLWENPHIYYELDVKDKDGKVVTWELEGGEPNPMHRRGWNKDDLQVGDLLLVRDASIARDGSHRVSGGAFFKNGGFRIFNGNGSHVDELYGVEQGRSANRRPADRPCSSLADASGWVRTRTICRSAICCWCAMQVWPETART